MHVGPAPMVAAPRDAVCGALCKPRWTNWTSASSASTFQNSQKASRIRWMLVVPMAQPAGITSVRVNLMDRAGSCGGANAMRAVHSKLRMRSTRVFLKERSCASAFSRRFRWYQSCFRCASWVLLTLVRDTWGRRYSSSSAASSAAHQGNSDGGDVSSLGHWYDEHPSDTGRILRVLESHRGRSTCTIFHRGVHNAPHTASRGRSEGTR